MTRDFDVTPYDALQDLGRAIERRVNEVVQHPEEDDINLDPRVIKARAELKTVRLTPGPTKILDVVAADANLRSVIRGILAERLVEVTK